MATAPTPSAPCARPATPSTAKADFLPPDFWGGGTARIGHHQVEIPGVRPIRGRRRRLEALGVGLHETAGLVLHYRVGHLVLQRIGIFDIADRSRDLLHIAGDALIAFAADSGRPIHG